MEARVDLSASRETSHCPLWFSLTHPAPLKNGLDAIVQTWPSFFLCALSPIALLPGVLERVRRTGFYYFSLPRGSRAEYGSQIYIPSRRTSSGAPRQEGPSVPSRGLDILPPTRTVETVGLASEGAQLIDSGLSTEVVALFALPSVGIRCLRPQSCPVV